MKVQDTVPYFIAQKIVDELAVMSQSRFQQIDLFAEEPSRQRDGKILIAHPKDGEGAQPSLPTLAAVESFLHD